jgi:hypothetical protein
VAANSLITKILPLPFVRRVILEEDGLKIQQKLQPDSLLLIERHVQATTSQETMPAGTD